MTNELNLEFPHNIDSTMIGTFSSCPQKFFQEFIIKKVPIGKSIHLHAGGCIASAMEDIRNMYYGDHYPLDLALEKAFQSYVTNWGTFEAPEREYKDFVNCWAVVEAYFREYPLDKDYFQPYMKADGKPAVEFKFAIPTPVLHPQTGDPILYSGRIDMLALPEDTPGQLWAVDEKTTKSMGAQWPKQWPMRGQFMGYIKACRESGFNVVGALVRGMCIQQTQFQFQEVPLQISDVVLDRWWNATMTKLQKMVAMYRIIQPMDSMEEIHNVWTRSFGDACTSYGSCQFVELCTHPYPWSIYRDWETRVWNPLAKDPTAESEDKRSQLEGGSMQDLMTGMAFE